MLIVVEGSAVPVHSIAFRVSSPKQAQELARFAAPFGGAFSPARHPERSTRQNLADTVYQVASRSEITSPSTHNRLICSTHVLRSGARTTRNNRRYARLG